MKKVPSAVFVLTFVLVGIQPLSAQSQGQWASTGAMNSTRELNAQVLLISRKVFSIGGADNRLSASATA